MTYKLLLGDCLETLKTIEPYSVSCCVTSPPYYGLRDYGTAAWEDGSAECDHLEQATGSTQNKGNNGKYGAPYTKVCGKCGAFRVDNQIGLEESPEQYVEKLVQVFREVRRVLADDGTLWLNLGDSYAGSSMSGGDQTKRVGGGTAKLLQQHEINKHVNVNRAKDRSTDKWSHPKKYAGNGIKPKDLLGIPWLVAFALRADGWYLRSDIIWAKPNPMPESVTDRPTKSHEYIFLLSKSAQYYYDAEAIAEAAKPEHFSRYKYDFWPEGTKESKGNGRPNGASNTSGMKDILLTRNKRTVWTVTTQPYNGAHFATFPPKLIEPCILAGSREGDTVLDPFNGSGTTGAVAIKHHRNYIGCELNPDYIELTKRRFSKVQYVFPGINS